MKNLSNLLRNIKAKDQKVFDKIEKQINAHAYKMGILQPPPQTEHPVKPPSRP